MVGLNQSHMSWRRNITFLDGHFSGEAFAHPHFLGVSAFDSRLRVCAVVAGVQGYLTYKKSHPLRTPP